MVFGPRRDIPVTQPQPVAFTVAGRNDLYGDAFNEAVFMRPASGSPAVWSASRTAASTARSTAPAAAIGGMSSRLRRAQNGFVRSYALTMMAGAAVVGIVIVLGRLG